MRFGIGTIIWGRRIDDLEYALDLIAKCGYQGVEFAQHYSQIYLKDTDGQSIRPIADVEELLMHLKKRNLELIGMVGGSLRERIDFLKQHCEPYLYLDRWPSNEIAFKEDLTECLDKGFIIALHPHWLMQIRKLRHAIDIIRRIGSDKVRLLLDTAHAVIAEDDPLKAIEDPEQFSMIGAVHLKDWRPDFGRWSHRYAHGFCLPGEGIVRPEKLMAALHAKGFQGWVVLEQDHYSYRRESTILGGAQWMERNGSNWGINMQPDTAWVAERLTEPQKNPFGKLQEFQRKAFHLGRELSRAVSPFPDTPKFYSIVTATLREVLEARAVKVWSHNSLTGEFCLLGIDTGTDEWVVPMNTIRDRTSDGGLTLAGEIVSHPRICEKDLWDVNVTECFEDKPWLNAIKSHARWMTVLPVFNTSNKHQLRFLITIFSAQSLLVDDATPALEGSTVAALEKQAYAKMMRSGELDRLGWVVAHWADYLTDQACSAVSGATNHLCGTFQGGVTAFIDALTDHLQRTFKCNSVTIFLRDMTGRRIEPAGKSGEKLDWSSVEHSYQDGEGHTGGAFKEREMVFDSHATTGRAREKRPPDDLRDEILIAPLVRRNGECHGVVRLHNKNRIPGSPTATMFTDDDAAMLDAVIQTALPYLELLMMQESQTNGIARMIHEFQTPLVAIRGAVDAMRTDLKRAGKSPTEVFRRDFLDLIVQWADLVTRLARNWKVFAGGKGSLPPKKRKTLLRADVVVPVLHQVRGLLPRRTHLEHDYQGFDEIPPLWIDRDQFQQVFFNLLSNSCKYGGGSETVRVQITAGEVWGSYCISYSDSGQGIPDEIKELIFLPGYRSKAAILSDMSGQGLGLFVVRSIIEAHGGTIRVISGHLPTTFEIILPKTLRNKPSRNQHREQSELR